MTEDYPNKVHNNIEIYLIRFIKLNTLYQLLKTVNGPLSIFRCKSKKLLQKLRKPNSPFYICAVLSETHVAELADALL